MSLSTENIARISQIEGVAPAAVQDLSERTLKSYNDMYDLREFVLKNRESLGISDISKEKIVEGFFKADELMEKSNRAGVHVLSKTDFDYPDALKFVQDSPLLLHAKGNIENLNKYLSYGIIGSTHPTDHGSQMSHIIGGHLGRNGLNVVSDLSPGINSWALYGSMGHDGKAIAVLPRGLDKIQNESEADLAEAVLGYKGVLLSGNWIGTPQSLQTISTQNRIIAGSTNGLALIESRIRDPSMETARHALELGRGLAVLKTELTGDKEQTMGNQILLDQKGVFHMKGVPDLKAFVNSTLRDKVMGNRIKY